MKSWGTCLFVLTLLVPVCCPSALAEAKPTEDILLQTRTDVPSLNWLLEKTSGILSNLKLGPGVHGVGTMERDAFFTAAELKVTPGFSKIQSTLSQVFHASIDGAQLRIRIPKISYDINTVTSQAKLLKAMDPFLNLYSEVSLGGGVIIGLPSGIQLDLMIPNSETNELESYLTAQVEPLSITFPKELPPATFELGYQAVRGDKIDFNQTVSNLDALPIYVRANQKELVIKMDRTNAPLTVDYIKVNPVTVRLGRLTRSFTFDDFKSIIQAKLNDIVAKVLPAVGDGLKTSIGPRILENIDSFQTRSDFQFSNANLFARYQMVRFSNPAPDQIAFTVTGQSCTAELYQQYKLACMAHAQPYTPVREISQSDHDKAKEEVSAKLASGQAISALSISEEYINRLLKTTIDAKLWDKILDEDNLGLGEKGAFVVFNTESHRPELILDLLYYGDGSRIQRLLINENKPIHFPLRISLSANFELRNASPFLVMKTEEVISTQDEIINGLDEYGIQSHLVWGFKGKISNMILDMAQDLQGKTALEMELPVLKGLGLEKAWFETSAYGRINLFLKP